MRCKNFLCDNHCLEHMHDGCCAYGDIKLCLTRKRFNLINKKDWATNGKGNYYFFDEKDKYFASKR